VSGQPAPAINLANTTIAYAGTAITDPLGDETVTGTIKNDYFGIAGPAHAADSSCPWGTVTAVNVDWGTTSGPAPTGTGPAVSGCVDYDPWVGKP
jgi:hypothetical protein